MKSLTCSFLLGKARAASNAIIIAEGGRCLGCRCDPQPIHQKRLRQGQPLGSSLFGAGLQAPPDRRPQVSLSAPEETFGQRRENRSGRMTCS